MHVIRTILIIEDNPADVTLLKESLRLVKFRDLAFVTRLSDLSLHTDLNPELVFLDLTLPDGRGMTSFQEVNNRFPDAAIIILSGLENEELALKALESGAQDYLLKGDYDDKMFVKSVAYSLERKRGRIRLRKSEERYRVLVENAPEALVIFDLELGRFVNVSNSSAGLFGLPVEKLLESGILDLSPEFQPGGRSSRELAMEKLQEAIEGGTPKFEWIHLHASGREIPCEISLVRVPSQTRILVRGCLIDISERKEAERRIRELEETRQKIMDAALDAIIGMDTEGKIIFWTPRAESLFGWKEEEVLGKLVADTIVPPRHRDAHLRGLGRYLAGGAPRIMNRLVEITARDRRGREFPVELTVAEITSKEGNFFCAFMRDITERILAREQVEKEKKLSDDIIESLPGLFYLFDDKLRYIRWNREKEKISGYSFGEISGMTPLDFFSEEDRPRVSRHIAEAFEKGSTVLEALFLTKSGQKIPYYFTGLRIDYEGKVSMLGMGIDISERVKAERLLRESSERLRQLSAHLQTVREEERMNISREIHDELGQQLTVMKMDLSWLRRKLETGDERVQRKMEDLMQLIDHTVKTVRKISSELRPSLLDDLGLKAALEWHCVEFERRSGISTEFTAPGPDLNVNAGVATAMFRVFQETLTNVARHANASRVEASLRQEGDKLVMRIQDNGVGFAHRDIENKKTLGILGMQERIAIIQGEYRIRSKPGEGTLVEVKVPTGNSKYENKGL